MKIKKWYLCNECQKMVEDTEAEKNWVYHTDYNNIYCPKCATKLKNIFEKFLNRSKPMNKIIIKSRRNGISILQLKLENLQLKRENLYYKAELKLTCNELDKSEKWQIFERRKKNKYDQTLQKIKAIAEDNQFYFGEGTIVSYKTIKQLATNFEKILDLITKAESEG